MSVEVTDLLVPALLANAALGALFLRRVAADCRREGLSTLLWTAAVLPGGVFAYYAFRVRVDARIRGESSAPWTVAALLLSLPLITWIPFHVLYALARRRVTVERVLERRGKDDGGRPAGIGGREGGEGPGGGILLAVEDLRKHFPVRRGALGRAVASVRAVDGVSFDLRAGETLGLVGESGSGKTTLGRLLLRLVEPTTGSIRYRGVELTTLSGTEMRAMRKELQIVFQDPYSSLNPRLTVGSMLGEALAIHRIASGDRARRRVAELLETVGLSPDHARRYPHEFSGGQRQRIGIARALAVSPRILVADEPVSALDVSIQGQVVNLLQDLQRNLGLAYLFIAHDLAVVRHVADRVAVMYLGKIVELAPAEDLYRSPQHPYTKALLSAIPVPVPGRTGKRIVLQGDVPNPAAPPPGCPFHPRCPEAVPDCARIVPVLKPSGPGREVACTLVVP